MVYFGVGSGVVFEGRMLPWVAVGVVAVIVLLADVVTRIRQRRKALAALESTWGQPQRTDRSDRKVDRWHKAGLHSPPDGDLIDDPTCSDLELDRVFGWADRTLTAIGSQTLYDWLRRPLLQTDELQRRTTLANALTAVTATRIAAQGVLTSVGDRQGWDVATVLVDPGPPFWGRAWMYRANALAFPATIGLGVLWHNPFLLVLGFVLGAINPIMHYVVVYKMSAHVDGLRTVHALTVVAARLQALLPAEVLTHFDGLATAISVSRRAIKVRERSPLLAGSTAGGLAGATAEYGRAFSGRGVYEYIRSRQGVLDHREALVATLAFVGEIDACLSLAHLRRFERGVCDALVATDGPSLVAQGLVHPLLLEHGVGNDVSLGPRGLLVTGSNMAGKSTFLRTVGLNLVLAQTLGIACAQALTHRPLRVIASMQAHDDLGGSVSLYQAEVLRILTILRAGQRQPPCMVLLDEVFRGTNPADRVAASAAVLLELAGGNVVLAATHDLALVAMTASEFDVGHFTERDDGVAVVFDYTLQPGISRRTNALAVLERLGYPEAVVARARAFARDSELSAGSGARRM